MSKHPSYRPGFAEHEIPRPLAWLDFRLPIWAHFVTVAGVMAVIAWGIF